MIRPHNIDYEKIMMQHGEQMQIGDLSASLSHPVFVAPYHCELVKCYIVQNNTDVFNSSQCCTFTLRHAAAASSVIGVISTAKTANIAHEISLTSHQKVTAGGVIEFDWSATCQVASAAKLFLRYKPVIHGENE